MSAGPSPSADVPTFTVMAIAGGGATVSAAASHGNVSIEMSGSAARETQATPIQQASPTRAKAEAASFPVSAGSDGKDAFSDPAGAARSPTRLPSVVDGGANGAPHRSAFFLSCCCPPPLRAEEEKVIQAIEAEGNVAFEVRSRRRCCPNKCYLGCEPPLWLTCFRALLPGRLCPSHVATGEKDASRQFCRRVFNAAGGNRQSVVGLVVLILNFMCIVASVASAIILSFPSQRLLHAEEDVSISPSSVIGKVEFAILLFFTAHYVVRLVSVVFVPPFEVHVSEDTGLWELTNAGAIARLEARLLRIDSHTEISDEAAREKRDRKRAAAAALLHEKQKLETRREEETAETRMQSLVAEMRVWHAITVTSRGIEKAEAKEAFEKVRSEKMALDKRYAEKLKKQENTRDVRHFLKNEAFRSRKWTYSSLLWAFFFFLIDPWCLVDLASFLPFWIQIFIGGAVNLGFVHTLRIIRIFLLFKFATRVHAFMGMVETIRRLIPSLAVVLASILLYGLFMAGIVFFLEAGTLDEATGLFMRPSSSGTDLEESPFRSILDAFYFVIVTLTTLGYGDMSATTTGGRAVASILAVSGVLILALPVGMMMSALPEEMRRFKLQYVRHESKDAGVVDEYGRIEEGEELDHISDDESADARRERERKRAEEKESKRAVKRAVEAKELEAAKERRAKITGPDGKGGPYARAFEKALTLQKALDGAEMDSDDDHGDVTAADSAAIYKVLTGSDSVDGGKIPTNKRPHVFDAKPTPPVAIKAKEEPEKSLREEIADLKAAIDKIAEFVGRQQQPALAALAPPAGNATTGVGSGGDGGERT